MQGGFEGAAGVHWMGGWLGQGASVDILEKIKIPCPCWESDHSSFVVLKCSMQCIMNKGHVPFCFVLAQLFQSRLIIQYSQFFGKQVSYYPK